MTLVHLLVRSDCRERVRVENCLDGPVWAPRRAGKRESGWDRDGYTGVIDSDTRLLLGYATPGKPREPPAEIVDAGHPSDQQAAEAVKAVRQLATPYDTDESPDPTVAQPNQSSPQSSNSNPSHESMDQSEPPTRISDWLSTVEERVEKAERLDAASSVAEASAAVQTAGGYDAVRSLKARVATDRESLEMVGGRSHSLQQRLAGVEIPLESLGYLD